MAKQAEQDKVNNTPYRDVCDAYGATFPPAAMESTGAFGPGMLKILTILKRLCRHNGGGDSGGLDYRMGPTTPSTSRGTGRPGRMAKNKADYWAKRFATEPAKARAATIRHILRIKDYDERIHLPPGSKERNFFCAEDLVHRAGTAEVNRDLRAKLKEVTKLRNQQQKAEAAQRAAESIHNAATATEDQRYAQHQRQQQAQHHAQRHAQQHTHQSPEQQGQRSNVIGNNDGHARQDDAQHISSSTGDENHMTDHRSIPINDNTAYKVLEENNTVADTSRQAKAEDPITVGDVAACTDNTTGTCPMVCGAGNTGLSTAHEANGHSLRREFNNCSISTNQPVTAQFKQVSAGERTGGSAAFRTALGVSTTERVGGTSTHTRTIASGQSQTVQPCTTNQQPAHDTHTVAEEPRVSSGIATPSVGAGDTVEDAHVRTDYRSASVSSTGGSDLRGHGSLAYHAEAVPIGSAGHGERTYRTSTVLSSHAAGNTSGGVHISLGSRSARIIRTDDPGSLGHGSLASNEGRAAPIRLPEHSGKNYCMGAVLSPNATVQISRALSMSTLPGKQHHTPRDLSTTKTATLAGKRVLSPDGTPAMPFAGDGIELGSQRGHLTLLERNPTLPFTPPFDRAEEASSMRGIPERNVTIEHVRGRPASIKRENG